MRFIYSIVPSHLQNSKHTAYQKIQTISLTEEQRCSFEDRYRNGSKPQFRMPCQGILLDAPLLPCTIGSNVSRWTTSLVWKRKAHDNANLCWQLQTNPPYATPLWYNQLDLGWDWKGLYSEFFPYRLNFNLIRYL